MRNGSRTQRLSPQHFLSNTLYEKRHSLAASHNNSTLQSGLDQNPAIKSRTVGLKRRDQIDYKEQDINEQMSINSELKGADHNPRMRFELLSHQNVSGLDEAVMMGNTPRYQATKFATNEAASDAPTLQQPSIRAQTNQGNNRSHLQKPAPRQKPHDIKESLVKALEQQIASQNQNMVLYLDSANPRDRRKGASLVLPSTQLLGSEQNGTAKSVKTKSASIVNMQFNCIRKTTHLTQDMSLVQNVAEQASKDTNISRRRVNQLIQRGSFSITEALNQGSDQPIDKAQTLLLANKKGQDLVLPVPGPQKQQPQTIVYDFKDLERIRFFKQNRIVNKYEGRILGQHTGHTSGNHKVQLSPIKKFTNQLTFYINRQYLNIEKLKPVSRKKHGSEGHTSFADEEQKYTLPASKNMHGFEVSETQGTGFFNRQLETSPSKPRPKYPYVIAKSRALRASTKDHCYADQAVAEQSREQSSVNNNQPLQRFQKVISSQQKRLQKQRLQANSGSVCQEYMLTRKGFSRKDYFVFGLGDRVTAADRIQKYRDFLWKINMSNSLFIQPEVELQRNYRIFIGRGNNSMLIRGLMKRRFWWTIVDKFSADDVHFTWTQLKINDIFKLQKNTKSEANPALYLDNNRPKRTSSATDDNSDSERNPTRSQNTKSPNITSPQAKLTQPVNNAKVSGKEDCHQNIFTGTDLQLWQDHMARHKRFQTSLSQKTYFKRSLLLKQKQAIKIENCEALRMHNHFASNFFIGNKKALFYSLRKYYELKQMNVFDFLPLTFHISWGVDDPEYKKFLQYYKTNQELKNSDKSLRNIWIVKPGEFSNRGTGITVCSSLDEIHIRLKSRERCSNGRLRTFIVQKYIQKPLLYNKRKFDIRHYMMITCINGQFKGYWYEEGYIRTTSYQYSVKNTKDSLIHLTNDAIQKNTDDYGKFQKGNKLSYADFQKYLDLKHPGGDFFNVILPQMRQICIDSIRASYFLLDPDHKQHNFEIFGMDFMIDQDLKPWLIQINTNPCLQLSCPLLSSIIPAMVDNALKIGLDPLFQPPYNWPSNKKYQLGDTPLQSNKFQIVFDERVDGPGIMEMYRNIDHVDKNMGEIGEEDQEYDDQGKQWNQDT